jgi:hypothetical protein
MEAARDLTHDVVSRDWQEYADACLCHDRDEPAVCHARELAYRETHPLWRDEPKPLNDTERQRWVLAATASTT